MAVNLQNNCIMCEVKVFNERVSSVIRQESFVSNFQSETNLEHIKNRSVCGTCKINMKFAGDGIERVTVLAKELSQTEKKLFELKNKYYQELWDVTAVKNQILLELHELKQSVSERNGGSNQADVLIRTATKNVLGETKESVMEFESRAGCSETAFNSDQPSCHDPMELIEHTFNTSDSNQPSGTEVLNDPMEAVPARKSEYLKSELFKIVQEILDEDLPSSARREITKLSDVQTCSRNKAEVEPPISVLVTGMKNGTELKEKSLPMKQGLKDFSIVSDRGPAEETCLSPPKAKLPRRSQRERKPKTFVDYQVYPSDEKGQKNCTSTITAESLPIVTKNDNEGPKIGKPRPLSLKFSQGCQKVTIYSPNICPFELMKSRSKKLLLRKYNGNSEELEKRSESTFTQLQVKLKLLA